MGRRGSGAFRPSPAATRSPAPQTVQSAPPPAPAQAGGGRLGSFGSSLADGIGWGTGISFAERAFDAIMGPRTIKVQYETVESASASAAPAGSNMVASSCDNHAKAFQDCLSNYGSEISKCQFYIDMLSSCRKNSGSMIAA